MTLFVGQWNYLLQEYIKGNIENESNTLFGYGYKKKDEIISHKEIRIVKEKFKNEIWNNTHLYFDTNSMREYLKDNKYPDITDTFIHDFEFLNANKEDSFNGIFKGKDDSIIDLVKLSINVKTIAFVLSQVELKYLDEFYIFAVEWKSNTEVYEPFILNAREFIDYCLVCEEQDIKHYHKKLA